jgi:hypothetical protein
MKGVMPDLLIWAIELLEGKVNQFKDNLEPGQEISRFSPEYSQARQVMDDLTKLYQTQALYEIAQALKEPSQS